MEPSTMTTGGKLEDLPFKWTVQGSIFLVASLAYMFDACGVLMPTYIIPILSHSNWHVSYGQLGWLGTATLIGMAIGAIFLGTLGDIAGRRITLLLCIADYAVFSCLSAAAPGYGWLLAARFITGLGLGGCVPVAYAVVAEFMPRTRRGMFLTAVNLFWPIGATLLGLIAIALIPYESWRLLLLCMGIPSFAVLLAVALIVPESPLFLAQSGRLAEAQAIYRRLAQRTGGPVLAFQYDPVPAAPRRANVLGLRGFSDQFLGLWAWDWKRNSAIWAIMVTTLMLYFSVIIWLPGILVRNGYSLYRADLFATSVTAIGIFANLIAVWISEIIGRKWIIVVAGTLAGVCIVLFTVTIPVPSTAHWLLLAFGLFNNMAIPVMYCYAPEVYPTHLRSAGFGWASAVSRAAVGMIPILFSTWLWPTFGLTGTFSIILGCIIVSMIWLALVGPETRGRVLG